jgi:hypothetical protein
LNRLGHGRVTDLLVTRLIAEPSSNGEIARRGAGGNLHLHTQDELTLVDAEGLFAALLLEIGGLRIDDLRHRHARRGRDGEDGRDQTWITWLVRVGVKFLGQHDLDGRARHAAGGDAVLLENRRQRRPRRPPLGRAGAR